MFHCAQLYDSCESDVIMIKLPRVEDNILVDNCFKSQILTSFNEVARVISLLQKIGKVLNPNSSFANALLTFVNIQILIDYLGFITFLRN